MSYLERKNPSHTATIAVNLYASSIINIEAYGGGMGLAFDSAFDGTEISYKVPLNDLDYTNSAYFAVFKDTTGTLITQVVAANECTYADPRVMVFPYIIIVATTQQTTSASVITCFPLS